MWSSTSPMPTFHITNVVWADSDRNITVDQAYLPIAILQLRGPCDFTWRTSKVVDSRRGSTPEACSLFLPFSTVVDSRWGSTKEYVVCLDFTFTGHWLRMRIDPHLQTLFLSPVTREVVSSHNLFSGFSPNRIVFLWSCWSLMTKLCHTILTILHT